LALPTFADIKSEELRMFKLVDFHGEDIGITPLKLLSKASQEARDHSLFMAYTLRG
jgi:hypothetical protein